MGRALKQFVFLLLALAMIGGAMPASAMSASMSAGAPAHQMADMHGMAMPCGEHKPAHNMPCDRQCCSCVLGAAALTNGPVAVASAAMTRLQPAWLPQSRPENLAQKPALPPPIA